MKKFLFVFILLAAAATGCARSAQTDERQAVMTVVTTFYQDHIPASPYGPGKPEHYRQAAQISPDLVKQIDAARSQPEGLNFDPFLCAQAWPQRWGVENITVEDEQAAAVLGMVYGQNTIPVNVQLARGESGWQISATSCFPRNQTP